MHLPNHPTPGSTSPSPMAARHDFRELGKNKNPAKAMGKKPERGLDGNAVTRAQRLLFTFQALSCTFEQFVLNPGSAYLAVTPCTNARETGLKQPTTTGSVLLVLLMSSVTSPESKLSSLRLPNHLIELPCFGVSDGLLWLLLAPAHRWAADATCGFLAVGSGDA